MLPVGKLRGGLQSRLPNRRGGRGVCGLDAGISQGLARDGRRSGLLGHTGW